jgi:hypothetical protein
MVGRRDCVATAALKQTNEDSYTRIELTTINLIAHYSNNRSPTHAETKRNTEAHMRESTMPLPS